MDELDTSEQKFAVLIAGSSDMQLELYRQYLLSKIKNIEQEQKKRTSEG